MLESLKIEDKDHFEKSFSEGVVKLTIKFDINAK